MKSAILIGSIFKTNNCDNLQVLEFCKKEKGYEFYKCRFLEYPCEVIKSKYAILKGQISNPMYPVVYNIGYIGQGNYNKANYKKIYEIWHSMLSRCYNKNDSRFYCVGKLGTFVCKEWHNFQNFCGWYLNNLWTQDYNLQLDKDILANINHLETKIYSPETCLLIPEELNYYFLGDCVKCGIKYRKEVVLKESKHYESRVFLGKERIGKHFNTFKEAKIFYSILKKKDLQQRLQNLDIYDSSKEILLKYDFSWSWIWENMTEEEILEKFYKYE